MLGQGTWLWWPSHVRSHGNPPGRAQPRGTAAIPRGGFPCLPQPGFSQRPRLQRAGARREGIPALPASSSTATAGTEPAWLLRALLGPAQGEKSTPRPGHLHSSTRHPETHCRDTARAGISWLRAQRGSAQPLSAPAHLPGTDRLLGLRASSRAGGIQGCLSMGT